jgi:hypothetical protein
LFLNRVSLRSRIDFKSIELEKYWKLKSQLPVQKRMKLRLEITSLFAL